MDDQKQHGLFDQEQLPPSVKQAIGMRVSQIELLQAEIAELRAQIAAAAEKIPPYYRLESLEKSIGYLAARHVNWIGQSGKLMDAVTKLLGANAELRAALRPFAEAFEMRKDRGYDDGYRPAIVPYDCFNRAWIAMGGTLEKGLPE